GGVAVGPEIAGTPLRIGLEAATAEDHGAGGDLREAVGGANDHPGDAALLVDRERARPVAVAYLDAHLGRALQQHLDQPGPAAHRFHVEPAPEAVLALDLLRLPRP